MILFADLVSIILSAVGLFGMITINLCMMLLHCFCCCSIIGAFYVYLILDIMLRKEVSSGSSSTNDPNLSDHAVLLILSLPFLMIFLIGCHSMYCFNIIYDETKLRKQDLRH